ncbi:MAG: hypothetical protein BA864_11495 [Desulfuromonadales bacterium C00003093]|nr:MAG: hypothetical protein BA864_11495 [Desulfuromonadales bacterium C00003093]
MIPLVDTHIHLDAPELRGAGINLPAEARRQGIDTFVIPGVQLGGWQRLVDLAEQATGVYAAPGLHPAYAGQWSAQAAQQLRVLVNHPKVVAIGEIGLDGAVEPPMSEQEQLLREQLQIAVSAGLPVLLHARRATGPLLDILRELEIGNKVGGIWHGFSGSLQVAQQLVQLGFKIGVGPILLRGNARKLPQAVSALPASALVLETDLPDMAETPGTLLDVARKIAELRGISLATVAQITTENARGLFKF